MESKETLINDDSQKLDIKSNNSSSKEKIIHPFIVSNINTSSIISPNNDNKINENNEKQDENEEKNEKKSEKDENKKDLIKSFEEIDSCSFNNILSFDKYERNKHSNSNDHISLSINKLTKGDDMDILNELISLCDFLSLSSERIGYNPNISKLLEEICKNLTKTYLPELIIYSLQCINYILDINPTLVYTLKKINGVASIMNTISCIEDITCVDYIIKIFDKISVQNSKILLENNVFEALLVNIFDFMNIYQKKSIMKICYNISTRRVNINEYNLYIKPAMNVLINIIRIDDTDNIDNLFVVEKATNIFYNIINYIKYGDLFYGKEKKEENIMDELITKYNIIENFMDILNKYFIKNVQIITEQLVKIILKTIVLMLEASKEGMDKILSNNLLEVISAITNNELCTDTKTNNDNNNIIVDSKKINYNINNRRGNIFLFEFFDILISLFPSWKYKSDKNKKILNVENKKYYDYFCQNIFLPLINNITNKSTNKILVKLIKLILAFINNTEKKDIIQFLPSKPISQIIMKLLDSKSNSSILDAISLTDALLVKAPEYYIVNFIREGIVHTLKTYNVETKKTDNKNDNISGDKKISEFCIPPQPISKSGRTLISKDNKDKKIDNNNNKDFDFELLDLDKKEKNNDNEKMELINDDESSSKKDEKEKEKEKNSEENIISIKKVEKVEKIENNDSQKEKIQKLTIMSESYSEDNSFILGSEENQEEENQDEDDMENNDDDEEMDKQESENNEKEDIEDDLFISKKRINTSSFTEEKEPKNNLIEKEPTAKIVEEESNNSINNDDIIMKDSFIPKKESTNDEKKIIETKIDTKIETKITITKKDNKTDDSNNNNNSNNNNSNDSNNNNSNNSNNNSSDKPDFYKKIKNNIEESSKYLVKRKKIRDLLKNHMKYNELEDNLHNLEKKTIELKIKELLTNKLTDEKITQYLSSTDNKTKDSLIKIQTTLSNYQQLLSTADMDNNSVDQEKYLTEIINILTDENIAITLFELENSKILLNLCTYFDSEFNTQYNKLMDDNEYHSIDKLMNHLTDKNLIPEKIKYNKNIFSKMFNFLKSFNRDKTKIINFIKLLNESIQRMNCPIFLLNENKKSILHRFTSKPMKRHSTIKLKVDYDEQVFKDDVLICNKINNDNNYKTKLCELNTFYATNKRMILIINDNTTFKSMSINLLSTANIPLIVNDKYDIFIKYFVNNTDSKYKCKYKKNEIEKYKMDIEENINNDNNKDKDKDKDKEKEKDIDKGNSIKEDEKNDIIHLSIIENNHNEIKVNEVFNIEENWTYKTFLENYSKKYDIEIPINIQFGLSIKPKNNNNEQQKNNTINNNIEKDMNNNIKNRSYGFMDYYSKYTEELINFVELVNFDKYSFIKDYHNNILYNRSIYFSKRLMPSLYLLSLLNICINKYNELFELPKIWFINNDKNKNEWKKLFFNLKIDQFIFKISLDPYKVSNTPFPLLGKNIINNNQSLTKFITRLLSFKTSFTSPYKSLINLQNHLKHNNPNYTSKYSVTLKKNMRIKINVERDNIIEHGFNIINDEITSKFRGYLEFEYKGEIGNGLGPTLEFYTLIINKIKEQDLWYKTTDGSLFPKLLSDNDAENENHEKILKYFKLLGYFSGRAIYDDRLLDIPLSKVFWNLLMDKPILFKNIKIIDSNLYRTLNDFVNLIKEKKEYIKKNNIQDISQINFDDIILYNKCKLSELDIYFTFPGYNHIELKQNGSDILLTMNNIEEYVNLIYDYLFFKGIDKIIKAFREGFNINFNIEKLKCFSSSEIEEFICGSLDTKWDKSILYDNLKPDHGYTTQSKTFKDLIKFMSNLDKNQRKKFLSFSTGSSRLPIGGFKSLSPKLTVVKKYCEEDNDPDDYLPTVMTCQNYMKIPEYSSYNILEKKLLLAMNEGCNEFNLS